jgi:hypothetical protein
MGKQLVTAIALSLQVLAAEPTVAQDQLPNPVKTCADVSAYITDRSMTMDALKKLLTASGTDLKGSGGQFLDNQCKLTANVKHLVMSQHVLTKTDGVEIRIITQIVNDNGTCRLTEISVSGC